jgi:hypothetical protein
MAYYRNTLDVDEQTSVSLMHIESIRIPSGEWQTMDALLGDLSLEITTSSGKVYLVSMNTVKKKQPEFASLKNSDLRNEIQQRWAHLLGN